MQRQPKTSRTLKEQSTATTIPHYAKKRVFCKIKQTGKHTLKPIKNTCLNAKLTAKNYKLSICYTVTKNASLENVSWVRPSFCQRKIMNFESFKKVWNVIYCWQNKKFTVNLHYDNVTKSMKFNLNFTVNLHYNNE